MLDDGAQRVAVAAIMTVLPVLISGTIVPPVGQQALKDVLEALGGGDGLTGVTGVGVLGELGAGLDGRRRTS